MKNNTSKISCKRGFTLIELLVVVLIIGILSAVAVPQYQLAVMKSRYMQLMVLGDALYKGEKLYYLANGSYTTKLDDLDISLPSGTSSDNTSVEYAWGKCRLESAEIKCNLSVPNSSLLRYNIGLEANLRECRVYGENELAQKVCANLTQDRPHYNTYTYYVFK